MTRRSRLRFIKALHPNIKLLILNSEIIVCLCSIFYFLYSTYFRNRYNNQKVTDNNQFWKPFVPHIFILQIYFIHKLLYNDTSTTSQLIYINIRHLKESEDSKDSVDSEDNEDKKDSEDTKDSEDSVDSEDSKDTTGSIDTKDNEDSEASEDSEDSKR